MRQCLGIDEAGFGPVLGPVVICAVRVEAASHQAAVEQLRAAALGIRDSKQLHRPGNLAPLETIALSALTWLTGFTPATAAEAFALVGEQAADRDQAWMDGAEDLRLPISGIRLDPWQLPGLQPGGIVGRIVHPAELNAAAAAGTNRAACELDAVGRLLAASSAALPMDAWVDRLGGRRYYTPLLARVWADADIAAIEETPCCSRYRCTTADATCNEVRFVVDGESASTLVALAGCISKYLRELHMQLFNAHWGTRFPWLAPTAGYGSDARRWIHQIGSGLRAAHGESLIRGRVDI